MAAGVANARTSITTTIVWIGWCVLSVLCQGRISLEATVPQGTLRGRVLRTISGRDFLGFMGIPYATPPVGSLRFMPPVRHPGWGGVLDATTFRSPCPQVDFKGMQIGEENCLFLNVFSPSLSRNRIESEVSFPVMVFLHGGFFESGSADIYGPEKFLDKGVVLVTLNYRLGVLGFFSTGDDVASGNWGLLDQRMALQWVRENIGAFGGDASSVTLFGEGAGAASVTLHMISPLSQGLFSRAIAQSGSALCDWSIERNPRSYALEISKRIRCPVDNINAMMYCLRRAPAGELLRAQSELKLFGPFPLRTAPVVESAGRNRFLPGEPMHLMEQGSNRRIPLMMGVNRDEGSFLYPVLANLYRDSIRDIPNFVSGTLLPRFLKSALKVQGSTDAAVQTLMFEYFGDVNRMNLSHIVKPFANMSTDALFFVCTDTTLKTYSAKNSPTYMYVFDYKGENSLVNVETGLQGPIVDTGVSHGDELFYLFNLNVPNQRPPSFLDKIVSTRILTLWTDFARYGMAPQFVNFEYPAWDQFTSQSLAYYEIDRELKPRRHYRQRYVDLWLRHIPSLVEGSSNLIAEALTDARSVPPFYRTLSWAMVAVCIALAVLIIVLIGVLYNQKKSQSFRADSHDDSRMSTSTLY